MYTRLIPPSKSAEFFGFYNMIGKFAAVIGPLLMGVVGLVTGSTRLSIVSIIILFVAGGLLLRKVDVNAGQLAARDQERLERDRGVAQLVVASARVVAVQAGLLAAGADGRPPAREQHEDDAAVDVGRQRSGLRVA